MSEDKVYSNIQTCSSRDRKTGQVQEGEIIDEKENRGSHSRTGTVVDSTLSERRRSPGILYSPTHPSDCQIPIRDSSLHKICLHYLGVQWLCSLHQFNRCVACWWCSVYMQLSGFRKLNSWSSRRTVLVLVVFPDALWNSVCILPTYDMRYGSTNLLSTQRIVCLFLIVFLLLPLASILQYHLEFIGKYLGRLKFL